MGGWIKVYVHEEETLRMGVYSRKIDGVEEYTIANKGTTPTSLADWMQNFRQPFGTSEDMINSIAYAKQFVRNNPGVEITFVGHSKGGAEATGNALATNRDALVFNPASINAGAYGLDVSKYTANMTVYVVRGDILHTLLGPISRPIDKLVYLPRQTWLGGIVGGIINHTMSSVQKGLE